MSKRVHVAVAVIMQNDHILIAQRHHAAHQGGKWEFPGGKVEVDEKVEQALAREINEELGLSVKHQESLLVVEHDYRDMQVTLDVCLVNEFEGEAEGKEGQLIRWVNILDLHRYEFPDANQVILDHLNKRFAKVHRPLI